MIDYNLWDQSAKISCNNIKALSSKNADNNFAIFKNNFIDNCDKTIEQYDKEIHLFRGTTVNKKSCVYKEPEYNGGDWVNQFENILLSKDIFNIQTKKR